MIRKAKAVWHGTGRVGNGNLSTDSGVLSNTPYSFKTRFENEKGTNPEELIAAPHAGCFTMAPSLFPPCGRACNVRRGSPPQFLSRWVGKSADRSFGAY